MEKEIEADTMLGTEIRYCSHSQVDKILLPSENTIFVTQYNAEKRKEIYALFMRSTSSMSCVIL
jgi:hypothetical protein